MSKNGGSRFTVEPAFTYSTQEQTTSQRFPFTSDQVEPITAAGPFLSSHNKNTGSEKKCLDEKKNLMSSWNVFSPPAFLNSFCGLCPSWTNKFSRTASGNGTSSALGPASVLLRPGWKAARLGEARKYRYCEARTPTRGRCINQGRLFVQEQQSLK